MKKFKSIMIMLLFVMATGCSNINDERQEDNSIAIEQQLVGEKEIAISILSNEV